MKKSTLKEGVGENENETVHHRNKKTKQSLRTKK